MLAEPERLTVFAAAEAKKGAKLKEETQTVEVVDEEEAEAPPPRAAAAGEPPLEVQEVLEAADDEQGVDL